MDGLTFLDDEAFSAPSKCPDLSSIRAFHSQMLDRMLARCLLRKQQEPISKLVNSILSAILQLDRITAQLHATGLESDEEQDPNQHKHKKQYEPKAASPVDQPF